MSCQRSGNHQGEPGFSLPLWAPGLHSPQGEGMRVLEAGDRRGEPVLTRAPCACKMKMLLGPATRGWGEDGVGPCHEWCSLDRPCFRCPAQTSDHTPQTPHIVFVTWIHPVLNSQTHLTDQEREELERSGGGSPVSKHPQGVSRSGVEGVRSLGCIDLDRSRGSGQFVAEAGGLKF